MTTTDTPGAGSRSTTGSEAADMTERAPRRDDSPRTEVRQYSLAQILGVWAAAAIPMGVLAWIVAPLLETNLEARTHSLRHC